MPKIFAISDLHLGFSCDKPMDIFGNRWENHEERLFENWQKTVCKDDIVLVPGDISWETYVNRAVADFDFINKLNGTKIITKGNHDYWWETLSKLNKFLAENNFDTIKFLHNTNVVFGNVCICGTKGYPETEGIPTDDEGKRLYSREILRLQSAVEEAKKTGAEKIIVLFIAMIAGYIAKKGKLLNGDSTKSLSSMLVYITNPCLIVCSLQREYDKQLLITAALVFA